LKKRSSDSIDNLDFPLKKDK